jgi:hypothetical protein
MYIVVAQIRNTNLSSRKVNMPLMVHNDFHGGSLVIDGVTPNRAVTRASSNAS